MTHRILHIVSTLAGGTARQVALLAAHAPRDEFELHVWALDSGGPVLDDLRRRGVETTVIGRRSRIDPIALWRLRSQIRKLQPHLVHTWQFGANTYGRLAACSAGVKRIVAAERHVDTWKTDGELALDRRLARRTDRWISCGQTVADFYLGQGLPRDNLRMIPCGVAPSAASGRSREDVLAELKLPADAKIVLFIGALIGQKRLKQLIWATDQLKALGLTAHLLLIGDGPLRGALERYARLNRIADRVHALPGKVDLSQVLAHADVLWQPSVQEGQSTAILAAMAAGLPVVAADAPGNRELVVQNQTGYLVPAGEKAGFARWTLPLLENRELAKCLGSAGRKRALDYFGADQMATRYGQLYRELLI